MRVPVVLLALLPSSCLVVEIGDEPVDTTEPVPTSVEIQPPTLDLSYLGETGFFSAVIRDQDGRPMDGQVTWQVDKSAVARIDATGTATAVSNGSAVVRANFRGIVGEAAVVVSQIVTQLETVSGTDQEGFENRRLSELIVVQALDEGGSVVSGAEVAFTPSEPGHGWTGPESAVTDDTGIASTIWVLGDGDGTHVLSGVADNARETVTARSLATGWPRFRIDLVLDSILTSAQKTLVTSVANKWESVLLGGATNPIQFESDVDVTDCGTVGRVIESGHFVETVELHVRKLDDPDWLYLANYCLALSGTWTPIIVGLAVNFDRLEREYHASEGFAVLARAMGLMLGMYEWANHKRGTVGEPSRDWLDGLPGADSHFTGQLAGVAFDLVGGSDYQGNKVPLENNGGFGSDGWWRGAVFGDEIMSSNPISGGNRPFSLVTAYAFADLGYHIDREAVEPYQLNNPVPSARIIAARTRAGALAGPTYVVSQDGTIVQLIQREHR